MTTDLLRQRAKALRLYGLLAHWNEIAETSWLPTLVQWEEEEHIRRSRSSAILRQPKAMPHYDDACVSTVRQTSSWSTKLATSLTPIATRTCSSNCSTGATKK